MLGMIVGVMALEAALVVVLVKKFSPTPQTAAAGESSPAGPGLNPQEGVKRLAEVETRVVKFRARNDKSAEPIIYDFEVFAVVDEDKSEQFKKLLESKQATIQDRFSAIVRSADPQRFLEPDLASLRDRFKHELSKIAGDDKTVKEVLIPSIVPYRE